VTRPRYIGGTALAALRRISATPSASPATNHSNAPAADTQSMSNRDSTTRTATTTSSSSSRATVPMSLAARTSTRAGAGQEDDPGGHQAHQASAHQGLHDDVGGLDVPREVRQEEPSGAHTQPRMQPPDPQGCLVDRVANPETVEVVAELDPITGGYHRSVDGPGG